MSTMVKTKRAPGKKAAPGGRPVPAPVSGTPAAWCVGLVSAAKAPNFVVTSGPLRARAKVAQSCLLEPVKGDSVACLRVAPDEVWILAVLQREQQAEQVLRCHGDTRLVVEGGALRLQARQVDIEGEGLAVSVQHTKLATDTADVVGRQLRVIGTTIKLVGSALSTVMERVNHFSKHYLRNTDGLDKVSATHIECEAKQLLRMEAEHTLVNGSKLVKARGAQIHFG